MFLALFSEPRVCSRTLVRRLAGHQVRPSQLSQIPVWIAKLSSERNSHKMQLDLLEELVVPTWLLSPTKILNQTAYKWSQN